MDLLEPVLELSLQVARLNLHGGFHEPNVVVSVEMSSGPHGRWTHHSQTEAIQSRRDCQFLKTIAFFANDEVVPNTKLQFSFKRLRKNDQTDVIGSAFCMVDALIATSPPPKKLQLTLNGSSVGYIEVKAVKISSKLQQNLVDVSTDNLHHRNTDEMSCMSRNHFFKHLLIHPISRTYRVSNLQGDDVAVYEYMLETPLSFQIPLQYLEMCRSESSRAIELMEKMGNLKDELETQRVSMMNKCREHLIQYKARIDSMKKHNDGSSPCIKKSADKTSAELEFVPINLHVQHMKVQHSTPAHHDHVTPDNTRTAMISLEDGDRDDAMMKMNVNEYMFVTVGATAAHSKGFKQGGLLSLLSSDGTSRSSRKNHISDDMLNKSLEFGGLSDREAISKLEVDVKENCYEIHKLLDDMRNSTTTNLPQLFTILDKISKQMAKLICCCDNCDLENAHDLMSSNMRTSSILEPVTSSSQTCDDIPDTNWEELKLQVKTALSALVKSVDQSVVKSVDQSVVKSVDQSVVKSVDQGMEEGNGWEVLNNAIELVEKNMKYLRCEAERALFHLQFVRSSSNEYYSDLFYRRRVVFSQALTMCACGIASTMLKTAGEHARHDIFEQYDKCGFLLQVESLLSTYGNETGMIQDYVIGVMDLRRISVKFEMKPPNASSDWSPASLEGSTLKLVLKIFLDETSFNLLPQRLKEGGLMKIHPTFFNVGINQEQTLAEKFGDTIVQDYLNRESFQRLAEYHEKVVQMTPQTIRNYPKRSCTSSTGDNTSSSMGFLPRMRSTLTSQVTSSSPHWNNTTLDATTNGKTTYEVLDKIRIALGSNRNKPVEILQLTDEVCRRLNGLRVTSCKSAKDRTAMSVTLEQASILVQEHQIEEKTFFAILSAMRSNGTRLENTMKNVGQRKYAFASVQLMTFPKLYRPPDGTYGKVEN